MRRIALLMFLAVSMLAGQAAADILRDKHTGKVTVYSKRYSVDSSLLHNAHATAGYSNKNGYSVVVEYLATGGEWMFFQEAWSFGTQFRYVRGDQKEMGCGGGCTLYENGAIRMSEKQFRKAAKQGFEFKILGKGGAVEGKLPAKAFDQVLSQLGR